MMIAWIIGISVAFGIGFTIGHICGESDYRNDHGPGGWFYDKEAMERGEFRKGIEYASIYIREFNSCTTHDWDLGDCILAKFNMLKRKIRKNPRRLEVCSSFKAHK